ncbi:chorismate--pyruvate lyase family protein [Archaeoglobus veneficus]|uniref:DUF98 domain-containing protein n=1 Tax=Archaeoglobus veneficus (strain DSM 11195 / SNP6) TaxID=693661 RepID=F2KS79_ARCVS|nr:chorismate pyruvate-lyase family protein [Archaeoglobus veneficus]AEA48018.1 protein of unknown function DUF98 [Archaeoglobus veneficus SNP6]
MELKPIHRILATTDGSITAILEAISGREVRVETVEQRVVKANKDIAEILGIDEGEEVNYRVVNLIAGSDVLAHAVSYTPLKRLRPEFREDLMKADIPIGKIMRKHRIEARREINWWKVEKAGKLTEVFGTGEDEPVLVRNYSIIHGGEVLINITEYFPLSKF